MKINRLIYIVLFHCLFLSSIVSAQQISINDSTVPENLLQDRDTAKYIQKVQTKIKKGWKPYRIGYNYKIIATFKIKDDGSISDLKIKKPSNFNEANNAALIAINKAAPFQKPKLIINGEYLDIEFTFDYKSPLGSWRSLTKDMKANEVIDLLGNPTSVGRSLTSDGEQWVYSMGAYGYSSNYCYFDKLGRLRNWDYHF